eukprot:5900750-Prymnesium_polylepis.1
MMLPAVRPGAASRVILVPAVRPDATSSVMLVPAVRTHATSSVMLPAIRPDAANFQAAGGPPRRSE